MCAKHVQQLGGESPPPSLRRDSGAEGGRKTGPNKGGLAFPAESRRDAPKAAAQGTETLMATRKTESLAGTERLREEVCELENCNSSRDFLPLSVSLETFVLA